MPKRNFQSSFICPNDTKGGDIREHIPWYLRIEDDSLKSINEEQSFKDKLVTFPNDSPNSVVQIVKNLKEKLAIRDIVIFDLKEQRSVDEDNYRLKSCDYVIIGTALSPKHCDKTFVEINKLLKNEYNVNGYVEGNLNPNDEKKRMRRLARRTNLGKVGVKKSNVNANNDSSWYMIDCKVDRIFLNILTKARREELNLEELYAPKNEKHLYTTKAGTESTNATIKSDFNNLSEEDNVLSALRKLAQQRRNYSTSHKQKHTPLYESLLSQNFNEINNLLKKEKNLKEALLPLAVSAVEQMKMDDKSSRNINVIKFLNIIKRNIPLHYYNIPNFWDRYRALLKSLFEVNPSCYGSKSLEIDYFYTKKSLGEALNSEDLQFLFDMVQLKYKKEGYWELVKINQEISKILKLFNDDVIFSDSNLPKLISTLSYPNEDIKLHSFYEVVNFLVDKYERNIPPQSLNEIIKILINSGEINYLTKLWQVKLGYKHGEADKRPWSNLISLVVESGNPGLMKTILENGLLLDIKRADVFLSKELKDSLSELFFRVDPDNLKYNELKQYLFE